MQAEAQAWLFTSQQEIGTQREEAGRTEKHTEVPLERARSEVVPKGKTKAQGDITCLQNACHVDLDWFSEAPVRDSRKMGSVYKEAHLDTM